MAGCALSVATCMMREVDLRVPPPDFGALLNGIAVALFVSTSGLHLQFLLQTHGRTAEGFEEVSLEDSLPQVITNLLSLQARCTVSLRRELRHSQSQRPSRKPRRRWQMLSSRYCFLRGLQRMLLMFSGMLAPDCATARDKKSGNKGDYVADGLPDTSLKCTYREDCPIEVRSYG